MSEITSLDLLPEGQIIPKEGERIASVVDNNYGIIDKDNNLELIK